MRINIAAVKIPNEHLIIFTADQDISSVHTKIIFCTFVEPKKREWKRTKSSYIYGNDFFSRHHLPYYTVTNS